MSEERFNRVTLSTLLAATCLLFAGCAVDPGYLSQYLSVSTRDGNAQVRGATCTLANDKGSWTASTPGKVRILRSSQDLSINCSLVGGNTGSVAAQPELKSKTVNVMFTSPGGSITPSSYRDVAVGTFYEYPEHIVVKMQPGIK